MVYNFLTIMSTLHVFMLWRGPLIVYIHKKAIRLILAQTKGIVGILDPPNCKTEARDGRGPLGPCRPEP